MKVFDSYKIYDSLVEGVVVVNNELKIVYANTFFVQQFTTSSVKRVCRVMPKISELIKITPYSFWPNNFKEFKNLNVYTEVVVNKDNGENIDVQVLPVPSNISEFHEQHWIIFFHETSLEKNLHDKYVNQVKEKEKVIVDLNKTKVILHQNKKNVENIILKKTNDILQSKQQVIKHGQIIALAEMASGIAHEINNPLAVISGNIKKIERLVEHNSDICKNATDYTEKINLMVERIKVVISNLKMFSQDSAMSDLTVTTVQKIIKDTLVLCEYQLHDSDVVLKTNIPLSKIKIECNPVQISQALYYLIMNANDAISSFDEKWIEISAIQSSQNMVLSVIDSGTGVPIEVQEKIFWPFFTTKDVGAGSGLGLSSAAGIITQHLGTLTVDNNSKNTKFVITLPLCVD